MRENGDTAAAARIILASRGIVDQERLYARVALTFPEVLRTVGASQFASAAPVTIADVLGDTAAFHWLAALDRADNVQQHKRAELEAACRILVAQLQRTPNDPTATRRLARALHSLGDATRARALLESGVAIALQLDDAMIHAAMELALAQFEAGSDNVDRAKLLVARLLAKPSAMTEAVVAIDPMWRNIQ